RVLFWVPEPELIGWCSDWSGWLQSELVERFGPPASFQDDVDGWGCRAVWQLGRVTLRHQNLGLLGGRHAVLLFVRGGPAEPSDAALGDPGLKARAEAEP